MGDIDKKWALGFIDWLQNTYRRENKVSEGVKNSACAPKEGRIAQRYCGKLYLATVDSTQCRRQS